MTMYMWLYKEDLETGVMVRLDEVDEYIKQGWLDTPDKWGKKGVVPVDGWKTKAPVVEVVEPDDEAALADMTKNELELYAKAQFNVDIDRRKNKDTLIKQIEALENG